MKPVLVLGLGNDLAGDDGIGVRVARRLAQHPELPGDVEVRVAGPDLLRAHDALHGRARVFLIDAVLGPDEPGTLLVLDPADPGLAEAGGSAHQLSPTGALRVLRAADPALADLPIVLLGITIEGAVMGAGLSDALADRLDTITAHVLRHLSGEASPERAPGVC
ncbi:MAG: hydrogenase maturation protease [Candidatus Longimicrobiales bacterium M2_2A_002]